VLTTIEEIMSRLLKTLYGRAISLNLWCLVSVLICSSVYARPGTCFDTVKIEPGLIAFNSSMDSDLGDWYQRLFGLQIVKEFSFPDGAATGVLMRRGEFIIEIFYRADLLQLSDEVDQTGLSQRHGVMKVGVFTDANLLDLQQCLNAQGVNAGRIFADEKLGIELLQVTDPEQNTLEIISRVIQ
jgi:hypothetical protein